MYEVILYAAIATVVCVVLYSVLGKQVGRGPEEFEQDNRADAERMSNVINLKPKTESDKTESEPARIDPVAEDSPHALGLDAIRDADPDFLAAQFLDGAKGAYSMILEAFADGDRETLSMLLTAETYEAYAAAIDDRERQNLTQVTDLARLSEADIVRASRDGKTGAIDVKYTADLSSTLIDDAGQTVEGDPDMLATVTEVWTFERVLGSDNPNWLLAGVAPSEGDVLETDPTPDTKPASK